MSYRMVTAALAAMIALAPAALAWAESPRLGHWFYHEERDPMTDAVLSAATIGLREGAIQIVCSDGRLITTLVPGDPMIRMQFISTADAAPVQWRAGSSPAVEEQWYSHRNPNAGYYFLGAPDGSEVAARVAANQGVLYVIAHDVHFQFPLDGAADPVNRVRAACERF